MTALPSGMPGTDYRRRAYPQASTIAPTFQRSGTLLAGLLLFGAFVAVTLPDPSPSPLAPAASFAPAEMTAPLRAQSLDAQAPPAGAAGRAASFMVQANGLTNQAVDLYDLPTAAQAALHLEPESAVAIGGQLEVSVGLGAQALYWVRAEVDGQVRHGFVAADAIRVIAGDAGWLDLATADPSGWSQPVPAEDYAGRPAAASGLGADRSIASLSLDAPAGDAAPARAADAPAAASAWMPVTVSRWWPQIAAAAAAEQVDPQLVAIVVLVESGGNPRARSSAGARGLMQLMPATATEVAAGLGMRDFQVDHLWQPELNLKLGTAYLADQLRSFGRSADEDWQQSVETAAAAYNGGPGTASAHVAGTRSLPAETRSYVRWVGGMWRERGQAGSPTYASWLAAGGRNLVGAAGNL